jgi:hypothetical protein
MVGPEVSAELADEAARDGRREQGATVGYGPDRGG